MQSIQEVLDYYDKDDEDGRLLESEGRLEYCRSKLIIQRFLPPPPAAILDVGGGTGPYSFWLAALGYEVHLLEPVQKHINVAKERNRAATRPLAGIHLADARELPFSDDAFDLVLLMGPLYHLTDANDRTQALLEARRVLKSNANLLVAYISRFASLLDGYRSRLVQSAEFRQIMFTDLATGRHRGAADGSTKYFTQAFLHHPQEIVSEIGSAGFHTIEQTAIESFGFMVPDLDTSWNDGEQRDALLRAIQLVEKEPTLLGLSPHIMVSARK